MPNPKSMTQPIAKPTGDSKCLHLFTWLEIVGGNLAGCKACKWAKSGGRFANYQVATLKRSVYQKHDEWATHKSNMSRWLASGKASSVSMTLADDIAPTEDDFLQIIDQLHGNQALGHQKKSCQMAYCVSEAIKVAHQRTLDNAASISLMRDESEGACDLRFRASDDMMGISTGFVGRTKDSGQSAKNIHEGTARILKRMSTRCVKPPYSKKHPMFFKSKYEKWRNNVHTIAIDAAANEILAVEMHRDKDLAQEAQILFPNLTSLELDAAHASRRLLRPWAALPHTQFVVQEILQAKQSYPQLLHHSRNLRMVHRKHLKKRARRFGRKCFSSHLAAAKHRFECIARPLGKFTLDYNETIASALENARTTSRQKVKLAIFTWLAQLCNKSVLLMGMMADGADEVLCFTRIVEGEKTKAGLANREAGDLLTRLENLYLHRQCMSPGHPGFTAAMVANLKNVVILQLPWTTRFLGREFGPSEEDIESALQVMCAWVVAVKEVIQAEFPDYQLCAAFQVFHLRGGKAKDLEVTDAILRHLRRIAQSLKVEIHVLLAEFVDLMPMAVGISLAEGLDSFEAWPALLDRLAKNKRLATAHPYTTMQKALVRFAAKEPSTSPLETGFAKSRMVWTSQRRHSCESTEEWWHFIIHDLRTFKNDPNLQNKLIEDARRTWAYLYGAPRKTPLKTRIDKHVRKVKGVKLGPEKQFIKERRAATRALTAAGCGPSSGDVILPDTLQKQITWWQAKEHRHKIRACQEGILLPDEKSLELEKEVIDVKEKRIKQQVARAKSELKILKQVQGITIRQLQSRMQGKKYWVDHGADPPDNANGMVRTANLEYAEIIVVQEVQNWFKNWKVRWAVALEGCHVVNASWKIGLKYHAATTLRRSICVSAGQIAARPTQWNWIKTVIATMPVKTWTISKATALEYLNICNVGRPKSRIRLAIVNENENLAWKAVLPTKLHKYVMTDEELVQKILTVVDEESCSGIERQTE